MKTTENRINEEYWDEIIKEVVEEKKEPMFTYEIWEHLREVHGYPEDRGTLEIQLFNLQREGYLKSILKGRKQAWGFPTGKDLFLLIETKMIDTTIVRLYEQLQRIPSAEEVRNEMKKEPRVTSEDQRINERLHLISQLLKRIDMVIKKYSEDQYQKTGEKTFLIPPDEIIFNQIDENIEDFDIATIELLIQCVKRKYGFE